jgi:hypothetical protein
MATHRLQILKPGTYCVGTNAKGEKVYCTFTPEHIRSYHERGNAMLAASWSVPVAWDHRSDAKPTQMSVDDLRSQRARGTAGHVERFVIEGGRLWADVDIPDEADAKAAKAVRFCSPEINAFTDGHGKDWGDVITHIALTPRPRNPDQPPIQQLSLTSGMPLRLSLDNEGNDMPDPESKTDSKPAKTPEGGGGKTKIGEAVEALRAIGIDLGNDPPSEMEQFLDLLIVAAKTMALHTEPDADNPPEPDDATLTPEPTKPPVFMGHPNAHPQVNPTVPAKVTNPALAKQQEQASALARRNLEMRILRLAKGKRITPALATSMVTESKKVQLSFDGDGNLESNPLIIKIEAYEELAGVAYVTTPRRMSLTPQPHPETNQPTTQETIDAYEKAVGRQK